MIKRLRVKGFKSLYDLDVTFSPLTVLFGANTSGKSNVLDVIQLLAKSATAEHIVDVFSPPFRGSLLSCISLGDDGQVAENAKIEISVDIGLFNNEIKTESSVSPLEGPSESRSVDFRYELEISRGENGWFCLSSQRVCSIDKNGNELDLLISLQGGTDTLFGDNSFLSLASFIDNSATRKSILLDIQKELKSWRVFSLDPQDGLRTMNEEFRQDANLGPKGENLASFLYTLKIRDPFQWETFQKALSLYIPEITSVDVLLNQHGEVELFVIEGGNRISVRLISDGTLNLMGLLAMSDTNNPRGVIGIDEPENGLHPSKMGLLVRLLETQATDNQQLIVTTHSPYLLDHIPLESIYVCQKENGKTRVRPVTDLSVLSCLNDDILMSDLMASGVLNG
jgi:predicted ATPase